MVKRKTKRKKSNKTRRTKKKAKYGFKFAPLIIAVSFVIAALLLLVNTTNNEKTQKQPIGCDVLAERLDEIMIMAANGSACDTNYDIVGGWVKSVGSSVLDDTTGVYTTEVAIQGKNYVATIKAFSNEEYEVGKFYVFNVKELCQPPGAVTLKEKQC
ncbi:hypothetical protein DRN75_03515 [Nanoarchaeota archaeon]|nr:MAG: hypothetical protein DRN75_03515 [Nanoarchaeota archaeon]